MLLRKITQTALLHMHDRPLSEPDGLRQKSFLQLIKINWQQILSLECRLDACAPYAQQILICLGLLLLLCWRISDRRYMFVSSPISEKVKTDHSIQLPAAGARVLSPPPPSPPRSRLIIWPALSVWNSDCMYPCIAFSFSRPRTFRQIVLMWVM